MAAVEKQYEPLLSCTHCGGLRRHRREPDADTGGQPKIYASGDGTRRQIPKIDLAAAAINRQAWRCSVCNSLRFWGSI